MHDARGLGEGERPVVVAVALVRMMEMAVDEIVEVISVGNRLVAAARAMRVPRLVAPAIVIRGASLRVGTVDLDCVLVDVVAMGMVKVTLVQVVDVAGMGHGRVPAVLAVNVIVPFMYFVSFHKRTPSWAGYDPP